MRQVTPELLHVAWEITSCSFQLSLSLRYLIPSHQYQLAVPHIRARTGLSLYCFSALLYTLVSSAPKGVWLSEWEITEEPRETGSRTHFWTQAEMQIWGLSMPFSQPCKLAHAHLPGASKKPGGGPQGIPICSVSPSIDFGHVLVGICFRRFQHWRWMFVSLTWASESRCEGKEMSYDWRLVMVNFRSKLGRKG